MVGAVVSAAAGALRERAAVVAAVVGAVVAGAVGVLRERAAVAPERSTLPQTTLPKGTFRPKPCLCGLLVRCQLIASHLVSPLELSIDPLVMHIAHLLPCQRSPCVTVVLIAILPSLGFNRNSAEFSTMAIFYI